MTAGSGTTRTRAELQAASRVGGRRGRANTVLAVSAVVLVVAAVVLGVLAYSTYSDASATRDATTPLETRAARLRSDLSSSDVAIDKLLALFIVIRDQNDATNAAVDATNKAAAQYNSAQSGIADALTADATNAVNALRQATAAVSTAVTDLQGALSALGDSGG